MRRRQMPVLSALLDDLERIAEQPRRKSYPMPGDARIVRLAKAEAQAARVLVREARRVVLADSIRRRHIVKGAGLDYLSETVLALGRALARYDLAAETALRKGT